MKFFIKDPNKGPYQYIDLLRVSLFKNKTFFDKEKGSNEVQ